MTALKIARSAPLDDLVVRVYHLELAECRDWAEFKEGVRLIQHNVDASLDALGCFTPREPKVRRAADRLKMRALNLRGLCLALPESFSDPERWREAAGHIIANYEQFRIEAGTLYRVAVPGSSFEVLRAAL